MNFIRNNKKNYLSKLEKKWKIILREIVEIAGNNLRLPHPRVVMIVVIL